MPPSNTPVIEAWVAATLLAAFFQTLRFMLQKQLSMGALSALGAAYGRFFYAAPFAWVLGIAAVALLDTVPPMPGGRFWLYAASGAAAQVVATYLVVLLFKSRNFAVGITLKKTEVLFTVMVGMAVLGDMVTLPALAAILAGFGGVILLSGPSGAGGSFRWQRGHLLDREIMLGLASGLCFAVAAVCYRAASLDVAAQDPLLRAGVTYIAVVTIQLFGMGLWVRLAEPGEIGRIWAARRLAVWMGVLSLGGSYGWFVAFTLQNAAYVNALGQIELLFSIAASVLFFREKITKREIAGIAVLGMALSMLVIAVSNQ